MVETAILDAIIVTHAKLPLLSVIVPVYNEATGIKAFHASLVTILTTLTEWDTEVIYCDDGSRDDTATILTALAKDSAQIKLLRLSRNFGKEIAITAGLQRAQGIAILTLDGDGQHPVELIPEFIKQWQSGAKVVTGIHTEIDGIGLIKRWGSKLFYGMYGRLTGMRLTAGATDFRLIDRVVQQDFIRLTERNRITRGLIDWLGYEQTYIPFVAKARQSDRPGYGLAKLIKLAVDSAVSLSISPLYLTAYIGAVVLPLASLLGLAMVLNFLIGDPFSLHITGGAYVLVAILFLMGIILVSQGIIGLYLSHIHTESQNRPLFIIDEARSVGLS